MSKDKPTKPLRMIDFIQQEAAKDHATLIEELKKHEPPSKDQSTEYSITRKIIQSPVVTSCWVCREDVSTLDKQRVGDKEVFVCRRCSTCIGYLRRIGIKGWPRMKQILKTRFSSWHIDSRG